MSRMTIACGIAVAFAVFGSWIRCQQPDDDFRMAYEKWQLVLDKDPGAGGESPSLFFYTEGGRQERKEAVRGILRFGPAQLPVLVALMKEETNREHVYRALMLLHELAGIDDYLTYRESPQVEAFEIRDEFIRQWESGAFEAPDRILADAGRSFLRADRSGKKIPAIALDRLRYYGVFGVPFIARAVRVYYSPEMFAAFLIITNQRDVYAEYIENPRLYPTAAERMENIRMWYEKNREKLEQVPILSSKIRKEIEQ